MDRLKISYTLLFPVPTMKIGPMARRRKNQSLGVFLMLNLGCPFMPGFKYLLERYFVMSSIPATDVAYLSIRALLARSKMLAA